MASGRRSHPALTGLLLMLFALLPEAVYTQVAVVVNRANPVANLSLEQLRRLYLGTSTTFPGGGRVILVESPGLRTGFYHQLLGMTDGQLKRHWLGVMFAGQGGTPPREIPAIQDLRRFVSEHAGAIAFLALRDADTSVKILAIGGVKPGEPKYPLRGAVDDEQRHVLQSLDAIEIPFVPVLGKVTPARKP